jgi:MarR family transcriptional regulator, organic hydroperoxide resistance regulator
MSAPTAASHTPASRRGAAARREERMSELGLAFRRVFRTLNRLRGRDTHLGASELSQAQFELLSELFERGELPAGELAAAARLTPGTVTQMLDHLAHCGHVERVRSETDRRVVVTRLTSSGREKIEAKRSAWKGRWAEALKDLPAEDLAAATRVLEHLAEMLDGAPPPRVQEPPEKAPAEAHEAARG